MILGSPSWPATLQPPYLDREPKAKVATIVIPFAMGTCQGEPLGKGLFALITHFVVLCSIVSCLFFCLFPSIVDDIHIISPLLIVSFAYEHF